MVGFKNTFSFELVDGKLRVNIGPLTISEEDWHEIVTGCNAFMRPVWDDRQKATDAEYLANYMREHNIQHRVETIDGVDVTVTTQGMENEICKMHVGADDEPRAKTSRAYARSGKASIWNVELWCAKAKDYNPRNPYITMRNKRGGAIAFRSPAAAISAAIRELKLANELKT